MDAIAMHLDLSRAPSNVILLVLQNMSLRDRFTCALVCKAWAEAATTATRSIILRRWMLDPSCLQRWLEKHGGQVETLQLHECGHAVLTALPCPKLQDLLLHFAHPPDVSGRVWCDIAAATKLTSVFLRYVTTSSHQADVVAALTALPDLQQLTWYGVRCSEGLLSDSSLLWQTATRLTYLKLYDVSSVALQHLSSMTKLQHLHIGLGYGAADVADYPGLQELKALTSLHLYSVEDIPASVSQLTALQELEVYHATPAAVTGLQVLTALTHLKVGRLKYSADHSLQLQLTSLQHLELRSSPAQAPVPMSFMASCKHLRVLLLHLPLMGPGSLVLPGGQHHAAAVGAHWLQG